MTDVILVGPLIAVAEALGLRGRHVGIAGRLTGGAGAGIQRDDWPGLVPDEAMIAGLEVAASPVLARYAAVFGLVPVPWHGAQVLGVARHATDAPDWNPDAWRGDLAGEIARQIGHAAGDPADIAARLPMIAVWADSRLRARTDPVSGGDVVSDRGESAIEVQRIEQPYARYFAVEEWTLRHRRHDGGWSPSMRRAAFIAGDAVVVLPWDPVRDRVLLIEQFRAPPAMRGDRQPWLLETIAGRIDAGETPEIAARREAAEEAGLQLDRLVEAIHHYPSPGAVGEYLYMYVAPLDLPDDISGIHGVEAEAEDIRSHLLPRSELTRLVLDGAISNGPLALLAVWLELRADGLRG